MPLWKPTSATGRVKRKGEMSKRSEIHKAHYQDRVNRSLRVKKLHICPACDKALYSYEDYKRHYAEAHLAKKEH